MNKSLFIRCSQETYELAHALGLLHEHVRPDRDDYIQVRESFNPPVRVTSNTVDLPYKHR